MNDRTRTAEKSDRSPIEWMKWVPGVLLALFLLVVAIIGGRIVLVPLLSSLALTYLLAPVVVWFERRGWSRSTAVLLTMTAAVLFFVLILIFILPGLWNQISNSYLHAQGLFTQDRIDEVLSKIGKINPQLEQILVDRQFDQLLKMERVRNFAAGWLQRGLFKLVDLTSSILDLLLIPFFVYYFLADYSAMRARLDRIIPPRYRPVTSDLIGQINRVVSSYVRSQLVIALAMGGLYSFGFLILRVPLAITIGMLSGLLNFVPYLGTLTGIVLALSFAALNGAGIWTLIGILIVFTLVQSVEGYYLTPKLLGSQLNLHPMWVLVGLMIGGSLFGLLGIILAVPLIAIGKVLIGFLEELYRETDFYRRPGYNLLTSQGQPIEIPDSSAANLIVIAEDKPARDPAAASQRRTIITTAEIRSRVRENSPLTEEE